MLPIGSRLSSPLSLPPCPRQRHTLHGVYHSQSGVRGTRNAGSRPTPSSNRKRLRALPQLAANGISPDGRRRLEQPPTPCRKCLNPSPRDSGRFGHFRHCLARCWSRRRGPRKRKKETNKQKSLGCTDVSWKHIRTPEAFCRWGLGMTRAWSAAQSAPMYKTRLRYIYILQGVKTKCGCPGEPDLFA